MSSINKSRKWLTPSQKRRITLILPPRVWSEASLGPSPIERLTGLTEFVLRFGMEWGHVSRVARTLTDAQLASFQPIVPNKSRLHRSFLNLLMNGTEFVAEDARQMKQEVLSTNEDVSSFIAADNKQTRDALSRGENIVLVRDVLDIDHVKQNVSNCEWFGLSYERIRINPILHRCVKLYVHVHLGYANCWRDKTLNVTVGPGRDDFTDISLALYAADGDVILTADKKFGDAFRSIDPHRRVEIKTWDEVIKTFN
ncbi:MAG: hypothetical protein AABZ47_14595 [Planctomycetota bacterium]